MSDTSTSQAGGAPAGTGALPTGTGAPAPGPAPAAPATDSLFPASGSPLPAVASPPPPPPEPLKLAPTDVPYPRFREVETERTEFKRRYEAAQQELGPTRARVSQAEQQAQTLERQLAERSADLDTYLGVLDRDPELRARVLELLDQGGAPGAARRPAAASPAPTNGAQLSPEITSKLDRALSIIDRAEQADRQAQKDRVQGEFNTEVSRQINGFLIERSYDPAQVLDSSGANLADDVVRFLVVEGKQMGLERMEDVPFLLNRWYARQEAITQQRLRGYSAAKVADAQNLPPPVPSGSPAQATDRPLPLSDAGFNARVMAAFRRSTDGAPA